MKKIATVLAVLIFSSATHAYNSANHKLGSQIQSILFSLQDSKKDQHPNFNRHCIFQLNYAEDRLEELKALVNFTDGQTKFTNHHLTEMFDVFDEDFDEKFKKQELLNNALLHINYADQDNCEKPEKITAIITRVNDIQPEFTQ